MIGFLASIPSPAEGVIEIGPLRLHAYGLMLAIGILVAVFLSEYRYTKLTGQAKQVADIAIWVVIGGIIGARVYHLFTGYDWDENGLAGTIEIWEGGLSIWGAVMGGMIAMAIVARIKHMDLILLFDAAAPGVVLAQAIGRWGNYFNQELFGRPTDLPWGLEIDPAHRPLEYVTSATFHPTFLYESIFCVLVALVIMGSERTFGLKRGQSFSLYIALYTAGRFVFENMRSDPASELGPLRFNAWVSLVLFVVGVFLFWWFGRRPGPTFEERIEQHREAVGAVASEAEPPASEERT